MNLLELKKSNNIAELLDEELLVEIGNQVYKGYEIDEHSRSEWKDRVDKAMEIAKQVMHTKTFPWHKASNIKYPLIAKASIDYASRTIPEIIQSDKVVKTIVIGKDTDGKKYEQANRVSTFMSYQLLDTDMGWEDGTDMLLQVLPVVGTVFRKTYYDEVEKYNCSELCLPDKICVNYDIQNLEKARRITHTLSMHDNEIIEKQRSGLFLDYDLCEFQETSSNEDEDKLRDYLEQHCYLDLDEDGYKEPYIVTIHKKSKKVLRIVHRFKKIIRNEKKEVIKIEPINYFTDYHFIRSPDGGFYSIGFGTLLLPINKAINTLFNLLIDSGTLNNMQGGLIGRGLRLKNGEIKFKMNSWQVMDAASGDDIRKQVFPWPTKEPSQTLYNLLGMLIQIGEDLSSTTDALAGKQSIQNVASSTFSQLVEQGTKVFVAINKRLYRSLKKEYKKLFDLNFQYLSNTEYKTVLDDPNADVKKDFNSNTIDILPIADPAISSDTQRIARAGALQQLKTIDPREADKLILQSLQLDKETIDKLLPEQDPNAPPPPEIQKTLAEADKIKVEVAQISASTTLAAEQTQIDRAKLEQFIKESESRINYSLAQIAQMQQSAFAEMKKLSIVEAKMTSEQDRKAIELNHKMDMDTSDRLISTKKTLLDEQKLTIDSKETKDENRDNKTS